MGHRASADIQHVCIFGFPGCVTDRYPVSCGPAAAGLCAAFLLLVRGSMIERGLCCVRADAVYRHRSRASMGRPSRSHACFAATSGSGSASAVTCGSGGFAKVEARERGLRS